MEDDMFEPSPRPGLAHSPIRPPADDITTAVVAHPGGPHPYLTNAVGLHSVVGPDIWDVPALSRAGVGVVHIHFGFETHRPEELERWSSELGRAGIALIHTVHDLDNPHLEDQRQFHRSVGVLVRAASSVFTLTNRAATITHDRYGVRPVVIPHPHVVLLDDISALSSSVTSRRRGMFVHAATVRPNLDVRLVEQLAHVASAVGGLHVHVRESAAPAAIDRLLMLGELPDVHVDVRSRLTDQELWKRMSSARLVVLPYRWGTHSGLLEAAHDLGTPVAAPDIGGLAEQGAHVLDRSDLLGSLIDAASMKPTVTVGDRISQRNSLVAFHRDRYRELLGAA